MEEKRREDRRREEKRRKEGGQEAKPRDGLKSQVKS
jgi:hypothetical protein